MTDPTIETTVTHRTPMPELSPMLKQLRLSGVLESLEQRNREAIEHKMTYPEFLALVIQDEAARRDQKKIRHTVAKGWLSRRQNP